MKKLLLLGSFAVFAICLCAHFIDRQPSSLWTQQLTSENKSVSIPSLAPLVERVKPAVLVVTTESLSNHRHRLPYGYSEPKQQGLGSGFIIHPSGLALTNNHVIANATRIRVKVGGKLKEYDAEIVGTDPDTDVALIQIQSAKKDWPVIPLGESGKMLVGDFAVAIGNPLGLDYSISFGPISALGRRDIQPSGKRGLFDFIQLSAPINPGNSGGALVNLSGEAIGINTAINAAGQGIAFAIPIDQVKQILPQLKAHGKVTRSSLGIRVIDVSPELAQELGLPQAHGVLIREVLANSTAMRAGLQPGDVITEFEGKVLTNAQALLVETGFAGVGKTVQLKLFRDGQYQTVRLSLEAPPAPTELKPSQLQELEALGIRGIQQEDAHYPGVRITEVNPYSAAHIAGVEPGDVMVRINRQMIDSVERLAITLRSISPGSPFRVLVRRDNRSLLLIVRKP
ncbi:MAG: trypsin-like peptidase domain-containing protein [Myxococcaceae bacterium]|nr:trypsin-like peptidase domain-containing protein [Myxococcaceae bacterium]MBH2006087.1 trypsin-like peptidase domain-containing protein [Myxococcaceae bacterium]